MPRLVVSSLLLSALAPSLTLAANLTIAPIRIDVAAPGNSATVLLTNADRRLVNVEVRLFKWALVNGADDYQESEDVVATPPVVAIEPGASASIRIVRTTAQPVRGEETYRLIVDEIPDANRVRNVGVNVALRYSLPVFFLDAEATQPKLSWSIGDHNGERTLIAKNLGDKHVRLSALKIGSYGLFKGLAGYVLGHSTRSWLLPARAVDGRIIAESDGPPINAAISR